ncbi:DNA topoisomerase IB [Rhodococcus sp. WAY2]|uniref:DNA topoisomerase IB n=1 Tax=Rhodococcus sp. WAY2 TaxID=2663121 RepID=UPI00132040C1|nr:Hypothetical protein GFS60_03119 [Rhodococcus sp. WAY2]
MTRAGRGFSYDAPDGAAGVSDEDRARIDALVIPPAWRKAWICPRRNGHIQAVGLDAAGRRQYIYHEQWRQERDEEKFDRVLTMASRLPELRERVDADLCRRGRGRERVEAVALRLLDRGVLRIGSEEYAETNGSRGVATLLRNHVAVKGGEIRLDFPAKSGVQRTLTIEDGPLATAIRSLLRTGAPSDRLLVYRKGDRWTEVHADDINARFKEVAGEKYTAKDLLGNTPQIARTSYVDPRVITAYQSGRTIGGALARARKTRTEDAERALVERAVIRLLAR